MEAIKRRETIREKLINRYKIHFYLYWLVLFAAQTYRSTIDQPLKPVVLANLAELGSSAAFASAVLFFLLPRLFNRGHRKLFFVITSALLLAAAFVSSYLVYLIVLDIGISPQRADYWRRIPWETIYTFLVASSFGFIKIADDYFRERTRTEELKKDKLRAELESLKAQINPHFLFNTLNNLYFMVEKDPGRAAKMILMLSDILRYQIYETDSEKTSITREIENIKSYVELERIRRDNIHIEFDIKGNLSGREVLGNILLPLVENAFKHLRERSDGSCEVNISVEEAGGAILFAVKNTASVPLPENAELNGAPASSGGLGMANLRRRLDLFYPGKYELEINPADGGGFYEVRLRLHAD